MHANAWLPKSTSDQPIASTKWDSTFINAVTTKPLELISSTFKSFGKKSISPPGSSLPSITHKTFALFPLKKWVSELSSSLLNSAAQAKFQEDSALVALRITLKPDTESPGFWSLPIQRLITKLSERQATSTSQSSLFVMLIPTSNTLMSLSHVITKPLSPLVLFGGFLQGRFFD